MHKVAIVVLAGTDSHESLGRVVNALEFAKELQENSDDVQVVFDGAGTQWIPELEDDEHDAHPLYEAVKENIHGACRYCSKAFGVLPQVKASEVPLLDDHEEHPSLRRFMVEGYQLVNF